MRTQVRAAMEENKIKVRQLQHPRCCVQSKKVRQLHQDPRCYVQAKGRVAPEGALYSVRVTFKVLDGNKRSDFFFKTKILDKNEWSKILTKTRGQKFFLPNS